MKPILITGHDLKIDEVVAVANGRTVTLDPAAIPAIQRSRDAVDRLVAEGRIAYGITTGFGRFKDQTHLRRSSQAAAVKLGAQPCRWRWPDAEPADCARHAARAGQHPGPGPFRRPSQKSSNCCSACSTAASIHTSPAKDHWGPAAISLPWPIWPWCSSVKGRPTIKGSCLTAVPLWPAPDCHLSNLKAKEGLALINGTTFMVGMGALQVRRAINLVLTADIAACLSLEALKGTGRAYDRRVHHARPHPRQIDCAAFLCRIIDGSQFLRDDDPNNVQDPYTLRCVPQVHGAVRDAIAYAEWVINIELNAANDNPLIFVDEETERIDVISAGNFHGEPIALAMDYMKLAVTDLGNMSERRVSRLVDADTNGGVLPMFLTEKGGLESGMMMAQYTAAALASENKVFAHPASADSISSSANVEDHVSMGATAVRHMKKCSIMWRPSWPSNCMAAAQGIDFRRREKGVDRLGEGTVRL